YNQDGKISFPEDYGSTVNMGNLIFGGISNSIQINNFRIDVFLQFAKRNTTNFLLGSTNPGSAVRNMPAWYENRWRKPGDVAEFQRASQALGNSPYNAWNNAISSNFNISNASFIRLKNVALSYQFPSKWINA